MRADLDDWFDSDRFRLDVVSYMNRQNLDTADLAIRSDLHRQTVGKVIDGGELTLRTVCALSETCDLDLDVYRLTQSEHDQYLDDKAIRPTCCDGGYNRHNERDDEDE